MIKEEKKIYMRTYSLAHREQARVATRKYYRSHKEQIEEARRKRTSEQKEHRRAYERAYYERNKRQINIYWRNYWSKFKELALTHYGKGGYACVVCGESRPACLSIDHINNNGAEHRRQVGSGVHFYRWLEKSDYPEGHQTLCMNCQFIKKHSLLDESR